MPRPSYPPWFHYSNNTCRSVQVKMFLSMQCSQVSCPFLLGPYILSILFSDTLNLRFSLSVRDQVSHPYKTRGRIMAFYMCILMFLRGYGKTTDFHENGWKHSPNLMCS
jgi:hypothetical protein